MNPYPDVNVNSFPNFFTIAQSGKNSWWRFLLTALLIGIGKESASRLGHIFFTFNADQAIAGKNPWPALIRKDFGWIGFFIALFIAMRWFHRRSFLTLISVDGNFSWKQFAGGFLIYGSVFVLALAILHFTGFQVLELKFGNPFWWPNILLALVLVAFQSFMEETSFRGYLFQQMNLILRRPIIPALIVGLVFSLVHIGKFKSLGEFLSVVPIFVLFNLMFFFAVAVTDSVALATGLHAANNYINRFLIEDANSLRFPIHFLAEDLIGYDAVYAYLIPAFVLLIVFYRKRNWRRLFEKVRRNRSASARD